MQIFYILTAKYKILAIIKYRMSKYINFIRDQICNQQKTDEIVLSNRAKQNLKKA